MALCNKIIIIFFCFMAIDTVLIRGQCDNDAMSREYKSCAFEHPSINSLVMRKARVSGKDIINVFNKFCKSTGLIHACVEDHIADAGCLHSEESRISLQMKYNLSESFCDGDHVIPDVADLFIDLPAVDAVNHDENLCLTFAQRKNDVCTIEIALGFTIEGVEDWIEKRNRLQGAMLCTYKGFGMDACPLETGLVMTMISFKDSVLPPLLGVNVTTQIINMKHFYLQHWF